MLSRNPSNPTGTSSVLSSYRRRKYQRGPLLIFGAIALIVIGIILLVVWMLGPEQPLGAMFATDTPTPTLTFTPTNTSTPTSTPTITSTPTETLTPTPSAPFPYTIQEGDTLPALAERFGLGEDGVLLILDYNPVILENNGIYFVGQTITIPPPGTVRATATPVPANLPRGTKIQYRVLPGDTLAGIAAKFNSIPENIIAENNIENPNNLQIGQVLQIPVNLITPTATLPPTSTPVTPTVAGQPSPTVTSTAAPAGTSTTCTFNENANFVTELQTLINNERAKNNLPALSVNQKLVAAAKAHTVDMLCKNYFSHTGSDGSTPQTRASAQGYAASLLIEEIYAQRDATPQSAFNWWMNDPNSRASILNPTVTEFGIAYVVSDKSLFGGYFAVVFAKP